MPTLRRVPVVLGAAEVNAVRKRATDARATPFAVLLAAWASLFAEEGAEVCVGVPISTRVTAEEASCVGLFLNTVLLPLATGAESLTALAELTQQAVGAALQHRAVPLPDVFRRLQVDRGSRHHPVAQMMFTLQPPGPREWQLAEGTRAELILDVGIPEVTRFDVVLNLDDRGDQIVGWLDYDAGAIDAPQVADLVARWRLTLNGSLPRSSGSLSELAGEPSATDAVTDRENQQPNANMVQRLVALGERAWSASFWV